MQFPGMEDGLSYTRIFCHQYAILWHRGRCIVFFLHASHVLVWESSVSYFFCMLPTFSCERQYPRDSMVLRLSLGEDGGSFCHSVTRTTMCISHHIALAYVHCIQSMISWYLLKWRTTHFSIHWHKADLCMTTVTVRRVKYNRVRSSNGHLSVVCIVWERQCCIPEICNYITSLCIFRAY